MEALVMGRIVLRYRSELLLNTDRVELPAGEAVVDCGDDDLRTQVLTVLDRLKQRPAAQVIDGLLKRVFPPPDQDVWLKAVVRLCAASRA